MRHVLESLTSVSLYTDIRRALPVATVRELWDAKDPLSLVNLERNTTTDRYGVSYWLNGDETVKARIIARFSLTEYVLSSKHTRMAYTGERVMMWACVEGRGYVFDG